jgi:hypothetical protein
VFARQDVAANLKLPSFHLPDVPSVAEPLIDGFVSGVLNAATAAPAASTSAVSARSAPTDGKFLFLGLIV